MKLSEDQTGAALTIRKPDITAGLSRLGISAGAAVCVHSSLSSFGRVEGGAEAVIDALMDGRQLARA